jgi:hypothetical protein
MPSRADPAYFANELSPIAPTSLASVHMELKHAIMEHRDAQREKGQTHELYFDDEGCLGHPQPNRQRASDSNHERIAQVPYPLTDLFAWQRHYLVDHNL